MLTDVPTVHDDPPALAPGRLKALLVALCAALALVVAGNSALAIALPEIATDLNANQSDLTWIIDGYALAFAALLLISGLAADRFGRRTVLVFGLSLFGGASVASAFSPDPGWLIALRALSGVGAAAIFPVTLSALVDAYPRERRSFAVGVWSGVSSAGAVAGTIVAGLLLEMSSWGVLQLLFGSTALVLVIPAVLLVAQNRNSGLSLDPLGAGWSVLALGGLVFGVIEGPQRGWTEPVTLAALLLGLAGSAGFVRHQLRAAEPSLDVRLFARRGLAAGSLIVTVQFFASLAFFVLAPQYLQVVRQYSALESALALLLIPVGVGGGIGLASTLTRRAGPRLPGALGLALMGAGFGLTAAGLTWVFESSSILLGIGVVVFGFGFGLGITPGTELILEGLPAERRSVASAVNDITREVGGVFGIAILSSVLLTAYRDSVATVRATLPEPLGAAVDSGAGAALGVAESLGPAGASLATAAREGFSDGFAAALWAGALVLVVTSFVVLVLAPTRRAPVVVPTREAEQS